MIRVGRLLPSVLCFTLPLLAASTVQLRADPPSIYPVPYAHSAENARRSGVARTLFGFTPFPYDDTAAAVADVRKFTLPNQTLYALHFDNGVPWTEALTDAPWPKRIREEWDGAAAAIPAGCPVYVALSPLATDRKSLAPGREDRDGLPLPPALQSARLDAPAVVRAYLNYARRAVRTFHPRFLNLGIESGQMMARDMARWPEFVGLFKAVHDALKREFPDVQMGISFGLGDLRSPAEAAAARELITDSDYVGLSFYPYATGFDAKFGAPPYATASGPAQWREPLAWIRAYTDKPIAICETGYTTRDVDLPTFGVHLAGSTELQTAYVRDLFAIARRDRYAFVVYFLAIDYDRLYTKLPPGSEAVLLWRNIGLIDGEVRPKPAWEVWKAGVAASPGR